jgi:hypothetical protein
VTNSIAFETLLNDYPPGVQSDSYLRGILVLGKVLADELEGSGSANPAQNVIDFLATNLASDPYLVGLIRQRLNTAVEKYGKGR